MLFLWEHQQNWEIFSQTEKKGDDTTKTRNESGDSNSHIYRNYKDYKNTVNNFTGNKLDYLAKWVNS